MLLQWVMLFRIAFSCLLLAPFALAQAPAILEVEVNQVLGKQLNGALDFVAGKDTAVRAFLAGSTTVDAATTKLVIERNGTVVTELAAKSYDKPVTIVEFLCPTRAACGNWQEGTYNFTATVNGVTRSTTPGTIVFRERQQLRILVRPVKANYKGTIQQVTGDRWRKAVEYVRRVYPVAADKISWVIQDEFDASDAKFDLETTAGEGALWNALTALMPQHCAANKKADGCYELIVGFIPSRNLGFPNGTGQGFTLGAPTNIVVASDEDMESTVAHEIAHIYGAGDTYKDGSIRCAVNPAPDGVTGKDWDDRSKTTSCVAGRTAFPEVSATLIPEQARSYEVGGRGDLGVKACFMGSGGKSTDYWVTPEVYKRLFDSLAPGSPKLTPAKADSGGQRQLAAKGKVVHFSGFLNANSDVRTDPWYTLESSEPVPDTTGRLVLRAVDANGNVLASQALVPQFVVLTNPPRQVEWTSFDGVIRFVEQTTKFQIVSNGTVKFEVAVNAKDPHIGGVTPTAQGTTVGGTQTIQWQAIANGPEPLRYLIEYNPDPSHAPLDWIVLGEGSTSLALEENFDGLPGGHRAKIRVTATDGVRSASAESQEFRVGFKSPEVFIDAVASTLVAGSDLELSAEAFDLQDDVVADARLLWRSSLSGVLGAGAHIIARKLPVGRHVITFSATNSVGHTTSDSIVVDVVAPSAGLSITTACPLNSALAGSAFSQLLTASGGSGTLTYSISAGALPAGLSLSPAGLVSGTAPVAGTASFTIRVVDSGSPVQVAVRSCSMMVNSIVVAPVITAACPLPTGTLGTPYGSVLTASGTTPIVWSLMNGALPGGLSVSAAGTVSGTPSHAIVAHFTLVATNAGGTASKSCSMTTQPSNPVPALAITTACPLPSANFGTAYVQSFSSSNGVSPLVYSITGGNLPTGLTLSATGLVSGTPTVAGASTFNVQVADGTASRPQIAMKSCSLTVNAAVVAPTIATVCPLPTGAVGTPYTQALTATGGSGPYAFTLVSGALPRPLTLSQNGTISGAPFHAGSYPFTLQVAGSDGVASQKSCSLTIGGGSAAL